MGLLERWDERNQAWADRKRAEPYPPPPSRIAGALQILVAIYFVVRFVAALAAGAWLSVILVGPLALVSAYILGYLIWARRERRAT